MIPTLTFTCPKCRRTSHHPRDAAAGYCSACHGFTAAMPRDYSAVRSALAIAARPVTP